jgi:hypothetical protein
MSNELVAIERLHSERAESEDVGSNDDLTR